MVFNSVTVELGGRLFFVKVVPESQISRALRDSGCARFVLSSDEYQPRATAISAPVIRINTLLPGEGPPSQNSRLCFQNLGLSLSKSPSHSLPGLAGPYLLKV